jgi:hypothetical protein
MCFPSATGPPPLRRRELPDSYGVGSSRRLNLSVRDFLDLSVVLVHPDIAEFAEVFKDSSSRLLSNSQLRGCFQALWAPDDRCKLSIQLLPRIDVSPLEFPMRFEREAGLPDQPEEAGIVLVGIRM